MKSALRVTEDWIIVTISDQRVVDVSLVEADTSDENAAILELAKHYGITDDGGVYWTV